METYQPVKNEYAFNPVIIDNCMNLSGICSRVTLLDEFAGRIAAGLAQHCNIYEGLPSIQISSKAYQLAYELLIERQAALKKIDEKMVNGSL